MAGDGELLPRIAVIGAGIFARTQYIPRLREISHLVLLKAIWSRTQESAEAAAELARDFAPDIECKWGDAGLEEIMGDRSILGVAVVLAGQVQVELSLKMLKAGKHVIQEKPASGSTTEAATALSVYNSFPNELPYKPIWALGENYRFEPAFVEVNICNCRFILLVYFNSFPNELPYKPIWALGENYRFEPAFVESSKLMNHIGDMMNVQVIVEGSMNSSNPYFNSSWRRNFAGGFILDMGVHFIAGLRMLVGSEVATVSSISRHVDTDLPPPDNICSLFQLENECAGVLVFAVNSRSPKILWRVDGTKGTVQIERGVDGGKHGYQVLFTNESGQCQKTFYPFCGVHEELKTFVHDMVQASKDVNHKAEPRSSYVEGARDVAVLEAMLESSGKQGAMVQVKKF